MTKLSANDILVLIARLILGAILIYSSIDKIADPANFARDIRNYSVPILGLDNLMAMVLPWLELIAGLALLSGIMLDGAAMVTMLMMSIFIVAISQAMLRGIDIECGCGLKDGEMIGGQKIIEDLIYFALALVIYHRRGKRFELFTKSV